MVSGEWIGVWKSCKREIFNVRC